MKCKLKSILFFMILFNCYVQMTYSLTNGIVMESGGSPFLTGNSLHSKRFFSLDEFLGWKYEKNRYGISFVADIPILTEKNSTSNNNLYINFDFNLSYSRYTYLGNNLFFIMGGGLGYSIKGYYQIDSGINLLLEPQLSWVIKQSKFRFYSLNIYFRGNTKKYFEGVVNKVEFGYAFGIKVQYALNIFAF